jgi:branched-subunit amino acid ABC-type transport system permease component
MAVVNEILQTVLSGISIGCVYGLVALGVCTDWWPLDLS